MMVLFWHAGNSPKFNPVEYDTELLKRIKFKANVWHHDEELKENVKKCIQRVSKRVHVIIVDAKRVIS